MSTKQSVGNEIVLPAVRATYKLGRSSVYCYGKDVNWSSKNPDQAQYLEAVRAILDVRRILAFRPNIEPADSTKGPESIDHLQAVDKCFFSGTHCPEAMWPRSRAGVVYAPRGEGTFLKRNDCYFLPTGDCPTAIVALGDVGDEVIFAAHCGVFSVIDPWDVEQLKEPALRKMIARRGMQGTKFATPGVLHHGLNSFGPEVRRNARAVVCCGIKGKSYRFVRQSLPHKVFAEKQAIARYLINHPEREFQFVLTVDGVSVPAAVYNDDVVELRPDIIAACTLTQLGLLAENIEIDDVDTASDMEGDSFCWHSNARDGSASGRNGIFVHRPANIL